VGKAGNAEVESGIVDVDTGIGLELEDVLLAEIDILCDGAEIPHHLHEAHDGKVADMADGLPAHLSHGISTPKAELRLGVLPQDGAHEVGTM
jgi:hypothetical protein